MLQISTFQSSPTPKSSKQTIFRSMVLVAVPGVRLELAPVGTILCFVFLAATLKTLISSFCSRVGNDKG